MDSWFSNNGGNGSADEDISSSQNERKKACTRHTPEQIMQLNLFAEKFGSYPSTQQLEDLGKDLGLDYKQVKYWFQNRRTHNKHLSDREENEILRQQNDSIRAENLSMKEALNHVKCEGCGYGCPPLMTEEHLKLKKENELLKKKHESAMKMLADMNIQAALADQSSARNSFHIPPALPDMSIQATLPSSSGNSLDIPLPPLDQFPMEPFGPFDPSWI